MHLPYLDRVFRVIPELQEPGSKKQYSNIQYHDAIEAARSLIIRQFRLPAPALQ